MVNHEYKGIYTLGLDETWNRISVENRRPPSGPPVVARRAQVHGDPDRRSSGIDARERLDAGALHGGAAQATVVKSLVRGTSAAEAITAPAARLGVGYEPDLVDCLLDDLGGGAAAVMPPQLQLVCSALYDGLGPDERQITLAAYEGLGGARGVLQQATASTPFRPFSTLLGISLSYPVSSLPETVTVDWDLFSEALPSIAAYRLGDEPERRTGSLRFCAPGVIPACRSPGTP